MRKGQKINRYLLIAIVASFALATFLLPSHQAHAFDLFSLSSITGGAVGYVAYVVVYLISAIAGVFIAIITYLIGIILQLSNNIVNTLAVQSGFSVTLAIANLGFILAIIIIALATILRRETYGIKKSLWKLIVAAILVNFSLVIGGVIVTFSNTFTNAFMQSFPNLSGTGGTSTPMDFAQELAGAFAPQRALLNASSSLVSNLGTINGGTSQSTNSGSTIASILTPVVSVTAATGVLVVIVVVLAVFLFLLLIRYVELAILLVLMPLAWLMWLFPQTSHLWKKWWSEFIRWTFFAPIVVFFLYLAIATAQGMNPAGSNGAIFSGDLSFLNGTQYQPASSGILAPFSNIFGGFIGTFAGTVLQGAIVIGLAIGGMVAANSIGIRGASAAVDAATSVGNYAKGYASKQTKKTARLAYQKSGGDKFTQKLRQGDIGVAGRIPLVGGVFRRGASLAGRGLENVTGNEEIVKNAQKNAPKSWEEAKQNLLGSMNTEDQLAAIAVGVKEKRIKAGDMVNGKPVSEFLDNPDLIKRFGQQKLVADADKLFMSDMNYRNGERAIENLKRVKANPKSSMGDLDRAQRATESIKVVKDVKDESGNIVLQAGQMASALDLMNASMKDFVLNFSKEDALKVDANGLFGPGASRESSDARLRNIALQAPQLVPNLLRNMKSPALKLTAERYPEVIKAEKERLTNELGTIGANTKLSKEAREAREKEIYNLNNSLDDRLKKFNESLAANVLHGSHEEGAEHGGGEEGGGGHGPAPSAPATPAANHH